MEIELDCLRRFSAHRELHLPVRRLSNAVSSRSFATMRDVFVLRTLRATVYSIIIIIIIIIFIMA